MGSFASIKFLKTSIAFFTFFFPKLSVKSNITLSIFFIERLSISCFVIVPLTPTYSINFLISLINSCIDVPQHSIKYIKVGLSIFTL